jgi:hypothetical protein
VNNVSGNHTWGPRCHVLERSAGPEGRSVQHFGRRIDVTTENPVRHPCRRPTNREIPKWQKHEARTRKLAGGRMSGGTANQVPSVRRIAQIPHEGGSIVDGALADVAKGLRMGGRDDHATSLGQGHDADEASKPGRGRHSGCSAVRIWTSILALQQVRLEGVGHAAPSSWHVITAGMTKGWCDGRDPSFRPCRVRATPARLFGSQLDDVDQPEDHQHDDDHADDPDATTSVVHLDLPFSCGEATQPSCGH